MQTLTPQYETEGIKPEVTGRKLISFNASKSELETMNLFSEMQMQVTSTSDFSATEIRAGSIPDTSDGIYYKRLGVAVIDTTKSVDLEERLQHSSLTTQGNVIVEDERVLYATTPITNEYLKGYYDAVKFLYEKSQQTSNTFAAELTELAYTWGLLETKVLNSRYSGKGVNVAVLDTGFFLAHPEFNGRIIQSQSFVSDDVDDINGHGTHCIGTALGPLTPKTARQRFGVAFESNIFAGKVLSNAGRGTDGSILDGIEWALENNCKIISMSLGAPSFDNSFSQIYESVAKSAFNAGTLIIAAAGNDSNRSKGIKRLVNHPANCPSIMSVAAVDNRLQVADFSNYGQVDVAAPGVDVFSCWISPGHFHTISGTSMATPHVAGIAALYAEAYPAATAYELWQMLVSNSKRLNLPSIDVGAGLVQAI